MWRVAKSLDVLLRQVNERWPVRDKSRDGTIGDAVHAARKSDHNPNKDGVVLARDITHDPAHGFDSYAFADMLLRNKDERISYIISNRRISSGTGQSNPAWKWRPYTGEDAHDHHVHISIKDNPALYDNTALWAGVGLTVPAPTDPIPPPTTQPVPPARPVLQAGSRGLDVRMLQQVLFVDGIFGETTENAVIAFQKQKGLDGDGIVGPDTWRELLKWAGQIIPPPVPTLPLPLPPTPPALTQQTGITATVFGGKDVQYSAYTGKRLNATDLYLSLPATFKGERPKVRVFANGKAIEAPIEDKGPWNIDDPYWETGARPQAETGTDKRGRKTNLAGIDLSPELGRRLGIDGKGKVDWEFVGVTGTTPTPAKPPATEAPKPTPASSWMDFDIWGWIKGIFK